MSEGALQLGILTVDAALTIRTWDAWLAAHTGISVDAARGRPIADVVPGIRERGLLPRFERVLATGEVQVLAPAFHHYLIPCPPSEASSHFDRMQQSVTLGPLREAHRIVGVMVTVEDVTARLDRERELAAALRSPDRHVREEAARQIAQAERLEQPEAFAAALGADDWRVRRSAVQGLSRHAERDMLASLLTALRDEHRNFNVLSSALQLLSTSDVNVTGPLIELLRDGEPDLRIQAALALGEQRHPSAIESLICALEDPDVNVRYHAIEALGRLRAADAVDALAAIAEGDDFFLAFPAIDALAAIDDGRVANRLVPLLARPDIGEAVADALGELGGGEVVRPLVAVLNTAGAAIPIARALARLHERYECQYGGGAYVMAEFQAALEPAGAERLVAAVGQASAEDLRALVLVLGWLRGPAVERALTRLIGQSDVRADVIEAIVRQDAGIISLLVEQLDAEDQETRRAAVIALGRLGDRRAAPALTKMLDGDRDTVLAATSALAAVGDPAAFEALLALLGHEDATIRQGAIAALNSLGHPEMAARVAVLLNHADPLVRESAVRIAGYFGYRQCVDAVIARCSDADEGVRRAAVEHLPYFDDERTVTRLRAAIEDPAAKVRAVAAQALAQAGTADARALLRTALRDHDGWVRYYAARSLGELRDVASLERLADIARSDRAMHVRITALEAVGAIDGGGSADLLLAFSDDERPDLSSAALRGLGRLSDPRALTTLTTALRSPDVARRHAAIEGLRHQHAVSAVEALEWRAGADAEPSITEAAIEALAAISRRSDAAADAAVAALINITADPLRRPRALSALTALPAARIPRVAAGLRHTHPEVRSATIDVLGRLHHPDASTAIRTALEDEDSRVRETAVTVLDRLGVRGLARTFAQMARDDRSRTVRSAASAALLRQSPPAPGGDAGAT